MNLFWLFFINLSVIGSLLYNVTFKLAPVGLNPFAFSVMVGLSACLSQMVALLVANYGFNMAITPTITPHTVLLAAGAGLGAALIDVSYFMALRYGTPVASQAFWSIGGLIALTIFSILAFNEIITLSKACGIILGIISLYLISRQQG